jgi:hypothetical protein
MISSRILSGGFAVEVLFNDRPPLPFVVRLMNGMERLGKILARLEVDNLLDTAKKRTGLSDFGDDAFLTGLNKYVESLERDASLTTLGRLTARASIMAFLENRLAVMDYIKRHPGIAAEEIGRPLFIIGLPRTGTTILQAVLDQDPANRSLLSWEALAPCPPPAPETYRSDGRIAKIQHQFDQLYRLIPGFYAIHPMAADMPQECVTLFGLEFMSVQFFVQFNVSGYQDWLDAQDMAPVYASHKRMLQFLQSGGVRGERWLLKSPVHISCIDELLSVYPDAAIIHTHRDPATVIASLASLTCMLRGISSDAVDPGFVARQMFSWYEKLLARSVEQRKRHAGRAAQFYDLNMKDLVTDPVGSVGRIYEHFGFELTGEVRRKMQRFMDEHHRDKHGSHVYRPEDFGLDTAAESKSFSEYIEYFNLEDNNRV